MPADADALHDDGAARWTTVHSRYHILGLFDRESYTDGELAETAQTRSEAFRIACAYLGPRGFDRVQVYDSMARRGMPELWDVTERCSTVLERRK